jgi:hypothetical protein
MRRQGEAGPVEAFASMQGATAPTPCRRASARGHGRRRRAGADFDLTARRSVSSRLAAMASVGRLSFLFLP